MDGERKEEGGRWGGQDRGRFWIVGEEGEADEIKVMTHPPHSSSSAEPVPVQTTFTAPKKHLLAQLPRPSDSPTMTVMTVAAPMPSPFNPARPRVSSPLAASAQPRPVPSRTHSFPTSRPLRPFPSIVTNNAKSSSRKPVKMIEPPANFKGAFVLNLTQAELSRQD
ncbi:hypothetical protein C8Q77DRAFT_1152161 [Trametes polyzona]|nr:hypothetical protein C8Q77DRAFT_1152161 [Trametes polyzona]